MPIPFENGLIWLSYTLGLSTPLKDARTSFFLSSDFFNFWICYTLWDKNKGNLKINWLFGCFLLLETIL